MTEASNRTYDLEERILQFAKDVRAFVRTLPKHICNNEDAKQLVRSSGSIGANYREANEALSKKDFRMRIKICRKEAKESEYWIKLIDVQDSDNLQEQREKLQQEALELRKIFGAIVEKSK